MDPIDNDSPMLDNPEVPPIGLVHSVEARRSSQSGLTAVLSRTNLSRNSPRLGTPSNENGVLKPSLKRLREGSRESSVLANKVANNLSLDSPPEDLDGPSNGILNGSDAEHEPTAPYTSSLPTGLCYDVRMRYHCELAPPKQRLDYHPEDPRRIFKIYKELCIAGLVKDEMLNTGILIPNPLVRIPAREVTQAEVCLVHDKRHFDYMKDTKTMPRDILIDLEKDFDSIYFNSETFSCALLSAGGAIETCRAVVSGRARNAIAVIRPPGHHAARNRPMGVCIFDNVSIAAKVCQKDFPDTCKKVLILDWDVHHGNGIQQAFYQDSNVLYISLHVHEGGNFYPTGPYGDHLHCGAGDGEGKTVNIPWPTKGMGDADYISAFHNIVMPIAYEFDPDLVIIAAGFDAADGDQLGGCFVTPPCYAQMTHMLMGLARGKLVVCLEGGYNFTSISKSALAVTRTLVGEEPPRVPESKATESGNETVQMVAMHQKKYWPGLLRNDTSQECMSELEASPMHDVVRYYQANQMMQSHNMTKLVIYRDKLSKAFNGQVMATPNFEEAVPLIVVFHDPPAIMGTPQAASRKLELQNTWLADGMKHYVDWAATRGYGVIDVNVPKHLSDQESADESSDDDPTSTSAANELATYLWENYIDCNDAPHIFFIGIGLAFQSVVHLLTVRCEQDFLNRVTGLINFVSDTPLLPVANQSVVYWLSKWYRDNSLIFVADSHLLWNLDHQKKRSKRYGNLVRSPVKDLNDMLIQHQDAVQQFILSRIRGGRGGLREED